MRYVFLIIFCIYSGFSYAEPLKIADKAVFDVELAQKPEELQKGLMFVKTLPENRGMIFDLRAFPKASMWMKNTYVPLDMLFVDCAFRVVDIYAQAGVEKIVVFVSGYNVSCRKCVRKA